MDSSNRKSLLSHCSLQSALPTGSHKPDLDLLQGSRGRLDQRASTASIILMDPVSLLGGKKFHQSAQRLSPAGGAGGWERRKVWNTVGDYPPVGGKKGCLQKERRGRKSKGKDGSGP